MPTFNEVLAINDENLSNPDFRSSAGVAKAIYDEGAKGFTEGLHLEPYEGSSYDLPMELEEASGSGVAAVNAANIVRSNGQDTRVQVKERVMHRDVVSSIKSEKFNSKEIKQRNRNLERNAKATGKELVTQGLLGTGYGKRLSGAAFWTTAFAGHVRPSGTRTYPHDGGDFTYPKRDAQKLFYTQNGLPGGTAKPFDSDALNEFHTLCGDTPFSKVFVTKDIWLAIEAIVDAAPGNVAEYFRNSAQNVEMLRYKGVTYCRLDALTRPLKSSYVGTSADGLTVTFNDAAELAAADAGVFETFPGFSDALVGADITVSDGTNSATRSIADVVDWKTVIVDSALPASLQSETAASISVAQPSRIIGVTYDGDMGFHLAYGAGDATAEDGSVDLGYDDSYTQIAGVRHTDVGRLQTGMRAYMDHIDLWGNFACGSVAAVAEMSGMSVV